MSAPPAGWLPALLGLLQGCTGGSGAHGTAHCLLRWSTAFASVYRLCTNVHKLPYVTRFVVAARQALTRCCCSPLLPRSGEFDKVANKLGDAVTKKQLKLVEDLSKGIVNKLLHGPMTALRCDGTDPDQVTQTLINMEALERMFELDKLPVEEPVASK